MWFGHSKDRPIEEFEPKIPKEGESYHNDAYSVYHWKKEAPNERASQGRCGAAAERAS